MINYLRWRMLGLPEQLPSVSARMLYDMARRYDEYEGEDYEGSSCRGALKGWSRHGVCLEEDWAYRAGGAVRPRPGWVERAIEQTLGVYYRIDTTCRPPSCRSARSTPRPGPMRAGTLPEGAAPRSPVTPACR